MDFNSGKPIFLQLEEQMRTDIVMGKYKPEEKLPGVRDLALQANVNPNTMQRALGDLEREGLLITRGTSGRFVCSDVKKIEEARKKILDEIARDFLARCFVLGVEPREAARLICEMEEIERKDDNE